MMFQQFQRPMQQWGMGHSYSPENDMGGGGGFRLPQRNTGIVPPHMQTGGPGQLMNYPSPYVPTGPSPQVGRMHTGGPGQMQGLSRMFNTGGGMPPMQQHYNMQTGGPMARMFYGMQR